MIKQEIITLSLAEQIDRARDGRTQTWVVDKMNKLGVSINEVQFSRKKKETDTFTPEEFTALNQILGTDFK